MGSIIQNAANNIGANGVFSSSALTNASVSGISALPSGVGGKPILLSTQTASASASISFTTGIDSTYDIYKFEFINIHPATDNHFFNLMVQQMVVQITMLLKLLQNLDLHMMKVVLRSV
jgi:hypothetical protein